ncbi:MAG: hypothetical protein WCG26_12450, partial [Chloroflexales bacterium]
MSGKRGNRGGFNPFRDKHGRWAEADAAHATPDDAPHAPDDAAHATAPDEAAPHSIAESSAAFSATLRAHAAQRNAELSGLLARQQQPFPPSVPIARAPLPVSQVEKTRAWQRTYMDGPIPADVPTTAADGRPRDELSRRQFNGRFTVKRPTAEKEAQIVEAATRIFGRPTSVEDVSRLSGAPDGATVEVLLLPGRIPKLDIRVDHPLYRGTSERTIKGSTKGPIIHNDVLKLQKDAPKGFGTR